MIDSDKSRPQLRGRDSTGGYDMQMPKKLTIVVGSVDSTPGWKWTIFAGDEAVDTGRAASYTLAWKTAFNMLPIVHKRLHLQWEREYAQTVADRVMKSQVGSEAPTEEVETDLDSSTGAPD